MFMSRVVADIITDACIFLPRGTWSWMNIGDHNIINVRFVVATIHSKFLFLFFICWIGDSLSG